MVAGLQPRRILLTVDDDPGVLDAYRAIFQGEYELLTATEGQAALQILQQRSVDVVLLDIRMPGGSGLAALDAMQALTRAPRVVVVSAINEAHSALAALRLGAHDYVTKPFDTDELELVVRCLAEDQMPPIRQSGIPQATLPYTLIVSGHLGLRASLAVALRTQGRVDSVPGAKAARDVLARTRPDAVVVDLAPGPDDREPLAVVREQYPVAQIITTDSGHLGDEGRVWSRSSTSSASVTAASAGSRHPCSGSWRTWPPASPIRASGSSRTTLRSRPGSSVASSPSSSA